jgi:alkanesulfonate monooxygenase
MYQTAETREWLTPVLWTGLGRSHGGPAIALVGSADDIKDALIDFKPAGVSQFILSGWPKTQSTKFFREKVLPRVRRLEKPHGSGMTRVASGDPRADRRR